MIPLPLILGSCEARCKATLDLAECPVPRHPVKPTTRTADKSFMEAKTSARIRTLLLAIAVTALTACDSSSEIKLRSDGSGGGLDLLKPASGAEFVSGAQPLTQTPQGFYVESSAGSYVSKSVVTTPRGYKVFHGVQSGD